VLFRLSANTRKLDTVYGRLHAFCGGTCRDGQHPDFRLIEDGDGDLYGTTAQGGVGGGAPSSRLRQTREVSVLNAFCSGDCKTGFSPSSGVTYQGAAFGEPYDCAAPLYGTTSAGASLGGRTIYVLARQDGKARVQALYSFCSSPSCSDGAVPMGGLTVDSAGKIFGVVNFGGAHDEGAVFELSPAGTNYSYSVIYSFCSQNSCTDGPRLSAGLPSMVLAISMAPQRAQAIMTKVRCSSRRRMVPATAFRCCTSSAVKRAAPTAEIRRRL
jgi:hypothetical protein